MAEIIVRTKDGVETLFIKNAWVNTTDRRAEVDESVLQRVSDAVWEACRREADGFAAGVRRDIQPS